MSNKRIYPPIPFDFINCKCSLTHSLTPILLPGVIHPVTIKGTFYFEPKQLELDLVLTGTWDEIYNVTNWQPGRLK